MFRGGREDTIDRAMVSFDAQLLYWVTDFALPIGEIRSALMQVFRSRVGTYARDRAILVIAENLRLVNYGCFRAVTAFVRREFQDAVGDALDEEIERIIAIEQDREMLG